MRLRLFAHLKRQDGISLVLAVGVLGVLSLSGATVVYHSSANARSAEYSQDNGGAYDLAEAGINEMMAVLSEDDNNAMDPTLLPTTTTAYASGTSTWSGVLDSAEAVWHLTSTGRVKNPTGATSDVMRTLTAKVPVQPVTTQELDNLAWNYVYSTQVTGGTCDMTLRNSVELKTRVYVKGNLCFENSAKILGSPNVSVLVHGKVTMFSNQNAIGSSTAEVAEAHIAGGCKYNGAATYRTPCVEGAQTAGDNLWAGIVTNVPQPLVKPIANYDEWYLNAAPGPYYPCAYTSGTPPTGSWATAFDNDQTTNPLATPAQKLASKNNSRATAFNLTPASSYTCRVGPESAPIGLLKWDASAKVLTVTGTIYIDGDVKVTPATSNLTVEYRGQATIYASGSLLIQNVKFCGGVFNGVCDFDAWDPNTSLLAFALDGHNRQSDVPSGVGVEVKGAHFQGALYATYKVQLDTTSKVDGPMVGSEVVLNNSVDTDDFPMITTVPVAMPGEETVYAQPNPPEMYSG
jgi:hypothetical protein